MSLPSFRRPSARPLTAAALLAIAGGAASAHADIISWLAASSGNWSNPAKWSDSNVPNSLNDVAYIGQTGSNYAIAVDFDVPVEALTLNSPNATINLNGARWLYVAAVSPDSFCHIQQGTFNVSGGATLKCDRKISVSEPNARIFLNNGALEGGELEVNDGGLVQTNGTGYLRTSTTYLGTPGQVLINVPDATTLQIEHDGHVIGGGGTLRLSSSYYGSGLALLGDVTNGAVITMSNHGNNSIYAPASADPDWQFSNYGTVEGSGSIGLNTTTLFNGLNAVIAATQPTALLLDPGAEAFSNNGTLLATTGGTLYLQAGVYDTYNPGAGTIKAEDASRVIINSGATVMGQVLATSGSGVIDLFHSSIANSGSYPTHLTGVVRILDSYSANFSGDVEFTGQFQLHSSYYGSTMSLAGDTAFYGGGLMTMSNHGNNVVQSTPAHAHTLFNVDCTVRGSGRLGENNAGLYNLPGGEIQAQGSSGLVVNPSDSLGCRNEGVMRALAGGRLYLDGLGFDNLDGTIQADQDGIVYLRGAGITSGQFTSTGNGYFYNSVSNSVLTDVTSHAPMYIPDGILTRFQTSLTNTADVWMTSSYYGSTFQIQNGNFALSGGGTVHLSNHGNNYIYAADGALVFTNQDNLITGSGQFGSNQLTIVNNATIQAAGSSGLVMNPTDASGCENNSLMQAAPGGRLYFDGPGFDNADGTIHASDTGIVYFRAAHVSGGALTSDGSGYFVTSTSNSVLTDITSNAPVYIPDGILTRFQSSLVNTDVLSLQSSYYGSTFYVQNGDLELSGGGTVSLTNHGGNYIHAATGDLKLINQDNLITGSGQFGGNQLTIVNNATIQATGSSGLVMNPTDASGCDNNALMLAAPGGRLYFDGPGFDNNDGTIHAADSGVVFLRAAQITGGQFTAEGNGNFTCSTSNSVLTNVTSHAPVNIPDGIATYLAGTFTNHASVNSNSSYYGSSTILSGDVTLAGPGSYNLSNHGGNYIYGVNAACTLTNSGNTIRGGGQLGNNQLVIVNGPLGTIQADVPTALTINPSNTGGLTNQGTLRVSGSGTMYIGDGPFTTSGTVLVDAGRLLQRTSGDWIQTGGLSTADGEIQVDSNNFFLQGGTVGGSGKVDSNVVNSGGTVNPGSSPGTLTIEGNYTQQEGGELAIQIGGKNAGEFDKLVVTGTTSFAGAIRLFNVNGYIADPGDQITVFSGTGTVTGTFTQVIQPIAGPRWGVSYVGKTVVLTAFCGADYDNTGFVDTDDFTAFVTAFELGIDEADFDGSGFVDTDDFTAFVIAFEAGC